MVTERELIDQILQELSQDGIGYLLEVPCGGWMIDVATPTTMYEVQAVLTAASLAEAVGRLLDCRESSGRLRAIVVAERAEGEIEEAIREAESWGVEVVLRA